MSYTVYEVDNIDVTEFLKLVKAGGELRIDDYAKIALVLIHRLIRCVVRVGSPDKSDLFQVEAECFHSFLLS